MGKLNIVKINNKKSTTKQNDKTHILIRIGKTTIIEYYKDKSKNEWKCIILNIGYKNKV